MTCLRRSAEGTSHRPGCQGALSETTNPAFKTRVMGLIDSVDTLILGANTCAQSKDYWPYADDQGEYGEKLNNLTKFVASSKLG